MNVKRWGGGGRERLKKKSFGYPCFSRVVGVIKYTVDVLNNFKNKTKKILNLQKYENCSKFHGILMKRVQSGLKSVLFHLFFIM